MSAVATVAEPQPALTPSHALYVIPREREDGFQATINGHVLDLADPRSAYALAPTPDDLFVTSLASELAWSTRRLLRSYGVDDEVSVSATWAGAGDDIELTVNLTRRAAQLGAALTAALGTGVAARTLRAPFVHISFEGVNR